MIRPLPILGLALALAGCDSLRLGPYTSPAVHGRVLAADSHRPLRGVEVRRGIPFPRTAAGVPAKGASLLLEKPPLRTAADGSFYFPSERALTLFRPAGWSLVQLSFRRAGYQPLSTNFPIASSLTNAPGREPLVDAGEILLRTAP